MPSPLARTAHACGTALAYGLCCLLAVAFRDGGAAVWLPAGVGAVAAFRFGWPALVAVAVADAAFNLANHPAVELNLVVTGGNVAAAFASGWLLRRSRLNRALTRPRDVLAVAVVAVLNPLPFLLVMLGGWAVGLVPGVPPVLPVAWWAADVVGVLVVAVAVLPWLRAARPTGRPALAQLAFLPALAGATGFGLLLLDRSATWHPLLLTAGFLALVLAAGWNGPRGAGVAVAVHTLVVLAVVLSPLNPFEPHALARRSFPFAHAYLLLTTLVAGLVAVWANRRAGPTAVEAAVGAALRPLAGGLAHDLNNRLTVVLGAVELTRDMLPPDSHGRTLMTAATDAAGQMSRLASDLLAYSGRGVRAVAVPVDVASVARDAAEGSGRVTVGPPPAEAVTVTADPALLRAAVRHLIVNGVESADGAEVSVTVTAEALQAEDVDGGWPVEGRPGRYASVRVTDTGRGMSAEVVRHMFDPYFTTKSPGRGLGLAVVAGVVRQLGGHVRVTSRPGNGTTVEVFLPLTSRP